jgi:hypoxanthine phosphoribosyltransferase
MSVSSSTVIRVLYDEGRIARRIDELAAAIEACSPHDLLVVAVLKGSFMFAADLIRAMHRIGMAPQVEFIHLSSYKTGTVSTRKGRYPARYRQHGGRPRRGLGR